MVDFMKTKEDTIFGQNIYSAHRRCLSFWHGPKASPPIEVQEGKFKSSKVAPRQNRGINRHLITLQAWLADHAAEGMYRLREEICPYI